MKIVVCVKQVPDTAEVKLDPVTNTLIREGVPSIINPDDKAGIEAALRLKEEVGGTVTILTMGPPQAKVAIREALAMGADEGILLSDRAFGGADTWATSTTIAGALKKMNFDIIIAGRQAIDGDTAQVGPQIAEHLGIPQVSYVVNIKAEENSLIIKRKFEDRYHVIRVNTPVLLTTLSELNEPRYMSIGGIFKSYKKEIKIWGLKDIEDKVDVSNLGLKGSPTKVKKSFTKQAKGVGEVFNVDEEEAIEIILDRLAKKYFI